MRQFLISILIFCGIETFLLGDLQTFDAEKQTTPFHSIQFVEGSTIGRIVINDRKQGISDATWLYVKAAVDHYKDTKPAFVILELNTPGGEVFAAQRISNALRALDTKYGIPVIAYINNWAISAGAMLAYSCRYIVAAPDASMGAATPVFQNEKGMESAPEKINSALRSDFANRAAFFDRNPDIARAMVDPDLILVRRDGKIVGLSIESELLPTDVTVSAKGKLVTLTADQLRDLSVADWVIPKSVSEAPDEEVPQTITLGQTPLRSIPAFESFSEVPIQTFQMDTKTSIVATLASPAVSSLLFFIACVCLYLEVSIPGVTLPGLVGGGAVLLLLVGSFAQESITWFDPICVIVGVVLISLELLFFPTLGILLVVGGAMLVYGVLALVVPGITSVRFDGESLNAVGVYVLHRLAWLSSAFLLSIAAIFLLSRRLPLKTLRRSGIILDSSSSTPEKNSALALGDRGLVVAALRPAGKVKSHGVIYDAVSDGRYIEEGCEIEIAQIVGSVVQVREHSDT
jgi:membrane-bound ClpP family serine protease